MIDIMMFLLVFFVMLTLSMLPNAGIPVELPGASTTTALDTTPVTIAIDKSGRPTVGGVALALDELGPRLAALGGNHRSVVIAADRGVEFQRVVATMDAVRRAGISTIGLAAEHR